MRVLLLVVLILFSVGSVQAGVLRTASGAGYKKIVEQWATLYEETTGAQAERIYGNMGQISAQVKQGGGICLVVGDQSYLSKAALPISFFVHLGQGRPVLVTRKGLVLSSVADLAKPEFARISAPDYQKAIYGRAAYQVLRQEQYQAILDKVMAVGTVPRSGAYAISGEVDAAFVNMSFALANKNKFGSMLELTEGFAPIEIVAAILNGCETQVEVSEFVSLLSSDSMQANRVAAGL